MKPWSRYNTLFRSERYGWFLHNTLTGIILELDESHNTAAESLRNGLPAAEPLIDGAFITALEEHGFLAEPSEEKLKLMELRYQRNAACFSTGYVGLTICPTLACNFACPYCFEHSQSDATVMDNRTIEALIAFIKKHNDARHLSVSWYGGEPTLAFSVIETLTEKFIEAFPDYADAGIVTNGYLLDHAKIERLVYASSSSVYGGNKKIPFSEDDPVDHPVSLYAATKKSNELMSHTYTHLYGLQTVGLRFFTVYGPMGRPDMAYWLFTDAMLNGRSIKVFNHGDMKRDFTYVDDIVAGVKASLFADGLDPYEIFNLGNNNPENLMEMIRVLGDALGVEPKMDMLPMQAGDVPITFADISKAQKKLGYQPTTSMEEGLNRFVDWYKEYFNV